MKKIGNVQWKAITAARGLLTHDIQHGNISSYFDLGHISTTSTVRESVQNPHLAVHAVLFYLCAHTISGIGLLGHINLNKA